MSELPSRLRDVNEPNALIVRRKAADLIEAYERSRAEAMEHLREFNHVEGESLDEVAAVAASAYGFVQHSCRGLKAQVEQNARERAEALRWLDENRFDEGGEWQDFSLSDMLQLVFWWGYQARHAVIPRHKEKVASDSLCNEDTLALAETLDDDIVAMEAWRDERDVAVPLGELRAYKRLLDLAREEVRLREESQIPVVPRGVQAKIERLEERVRERAAAIESLEAEVTILRRERDGARAALAEAVCQRCGGDGYVDSWEDDQTDVVTTLCPDCQASSE